MNPNTTAQAISSPMYSSLAVPNSMPASNVNAAPLTVPPAPLSSTDALQSLVAQATTGLNTAQAADTTAEKDLSNSKDQRKNLQSLLLGETPDTIAAQQSQGIPQLNNDIRGLQLDIQSKQQKYLQGLTNIESGNIRSLSNNQNVALSRQNALDVAISRGNLEATQGNLIYANQLVKDAVTAKYQPIKDALEMQNQIVKEGYDTLDRSDKKLADAKKTENDLELKRIQRQEEDEKDKQTLSLTIAKNQAPASVVAAVGKAKSFNDAIALASPYMQSLTDKADVAYKVAQTAKIYNEMKADTALSTSPANTLAYAQEYATTGKIPTGIPKGSFGAIAQYAKELPKQKGQIVSTATGVAPSGDDSYTTGLAALNSAKELAVQLKELDKQRIGGVVAGSLGATFGSDDQQRYVDLRDQIVDLLSRARSGAALSPSEEKRYSDMLPGRFSEPLGLGVNSESRIDNFTDALTSDLTNKASAKGLSIYGVSKVKLGDKEYTVGDIIKSPDGKTGRINPDKTITIIE